MGIDEWVFAIKHRWARLICRLIGCDIHSYRNSRMPDDWTPTDNCIRCSACHDVYNIESTDFDLIYPCESIAGKRKTKMDANDLFPPSQYLRSEDVELVGEMQLTITGVSRKEFVDDSGKKEVKGDLTFTETDKKLSINVTNTNTLITMFGAKDIDKNWVGKQITLYVDPNVKYGTKIVKGLRIRLVDPKQDAITAFWFEVKKMGLTNIEGQAIAKENGGDFKKALAALNSPF
jgi:hypothetical protein